MKRYKRVLIALSLSGHADRKLITQAKAAQASGARVYLIHSVVCLSGYGTMYGVSIEQDLERLLYDEAAKKMAKIGRRLGINDKKLVIKTGKPKQVVLDFAKEQHVDLIIVGTHGSRGVGLLLGETADRIIHYAPCDVLSVRVA